MSIIDLLIVLLYLLAVFAFALTKGKSVNLEEYFIGKRGFKTTFLVFTVVSSNVGAGTYIGLASAGYTTGIGYAVFGMSVSLLGFLIIAYFAPKIKIFGDSNRAFTLSDFFLVKYDKKTQYLSAIVISLIYLLFLTSQFLGIGLLLEVWAGWKLLLAISVSAISLIIYTSIAGAKSDMYTDLIHFIIMAIALLVLIFVRMGSNSIIQIKNYVELVPKEYFDVSNFGGWTFFILGIVFGSPLMLVSMELWQRIYAANTAKIARRTILASALINSIFLIFPLMIGLLAKAEGVITDNPDKVLLLMIKNYLPPVILGFGLAGLVAAFLSTANTMIMVISSSLLNNLVKPKLESVSIYKSNSELLNIGRGLTFVIGCFGILIAILIPDIIRLSLNSFSIILVLIPSVLGGLVLNKLNANGAYYSILIGFIVSVIFSFINPKMAFIPGFLISVVVYLFFHYFKKIES